MRAKKAVLLLNLGTPDSTKTSDVRKYLREFLMDGRVLDINPIGRWFLVNGIIAPFRSPKSGAEYKELFTERGSPLLYHGLDLTKAVQEKIGGDYDVYFGMRYQSPNMVDVLEEIEKKGYEELAVLPLYPHYASASTGSTIAKLNEVVGNWQIIPNIKVISHFPTQPKMIDTFVEQAKEMIEKSDYEHFVFSYHGLPERQILKGSCDNYCQLGDCCNKYGSKNSYCYRAQCFETTRALVAKMGLTEDQYSICFQSRLGRAEWIKPYLDDAIIDIRKRDIKRVLVFSPAFVADCLETTVEIGIRYEKTFKEQGGEQWDLVPSLNTHPKWVEAVVDMVKG